MSKLGGVSPFGQKKVEISAVQYFKDSFAISIADYDRGSVDDAGNHVPQVEMEPVIQFACQGGKGTGAQVIPFDELAECVKAYQEIIDCGFNRPGAPAGDGYVPTHENIRSSWKMVRPTIKVMKDGKEVRITDNTAPADYVSVRVGRGQGAKPIVVHKTEFVEIVGLLRQIEQNSEEYISSVWANYEAEANKPSKAAK